MVRPRRNRRYLPIAFTALLVFSAAQAGWWILDQWIYSGQVEATSRRMYGAQIAAAQDLLSRGASEQEVRRLFPGLRVAGGLVEIAPETDAGLIEARRRRLNQYVWEGGFFLVVLLASIGVIARSLRQEARLRRRQQNFLASVSHELKSPLASARIAAETLGLRDPPPEARQRQVERVLRSIDRLDRMITNLLETVRIEEGRMVLSGREQALGEVLQGTIGSFSERAQGAGIHFRVEIAAGVRAYADAEALRTVVRNLLENAFAAVESASDPEVRIRARPDGRVVVIEVLDNGCGFEPRNAPRLFEKFYRPGDEMRRGGRGAGLGLHIVRALVLRSGGEIEASSSGLGHGAAFRVRWPAGAPPDPTVGSGA